MTRTPLVPSDLLRFALPNDPNIAPDGRVFYVLATQSEAANETLTSIWSVRAGAPAARFTSGDHDRSPRVSPDGRMLAFVGDRGDGKRAYVVALDGGEARAIAPAYDGIGSLTWSPDSQTLAYVATAPLDAQTARIAHDEKTGARHIRALPFKSDDDGLLDGRRKHLFTIDVARGGEPRRVTHGDYDVQTPAWSPDGATIAFAAQIDAPEYAFYTDIHVVSVADGTLAKRTRSRGPASHPSFSHDGTTLAYIGHENGDDAGGRFNAELLLLPVAGGEPTSLSAHVDRSVIDFVICDIRGTGGQQAPVWSENDDELFVPLSDAGSCGIAAFARDGGAHRVLLGGDRDIYTFTRNAAGTFAFVYSTPTVPSEIGLFGASREEMQVTTSNPWLDERTIRAPRRVRPHAGDGQRLDLWILDPDDAQDAPYVLQVHGGPHAAYGHAFMIEFQVLAAHGIGVAYGNPRGSQTYGHAYANAITGDWGGIDASDVLSLLDGAAANAALDRERLGLAGGSYGGFMTTWLLGHSKRFAAGVSMRAVNDLVSEVGATDLGWFIEREVGSPWTADAGLKLFLGSPIRNAHEIDVPLLVEHSERDFRCAIDQGEQLFTLLRRLGRTQTEFVRFTGDGHGLSRNGNPRNRILRLRAIAHWFVRHLKPKGVTAVADTAGALFEPLPTEPVAEPKPA
ncbi:MAG: S9 family peptidase [Vulcanimicrobiaceae bacterium]